MQTKYYANLSVAKLIITIGYGNEKILVHLTCSMYYRKNKSSVAHNLDKNSEFTQEAAEVVPSSIILFLVKELTVIINHSIHKFISVF